MANSNLTKPFRASGRLFLGDYSASPEARVLKDTGNVAAFQFQAEVETTEIPNTANGAGGAAYVDTRVKSATLSMSFDFWDPTLRAAASFGAVNDVTAGAVADEAHTAHGGALVRFDHIADLSVAPVVTNAAGTTTYVASTDYTLEENGHGLLIVAGGAILDASAIEVSYTKKAHQVIEALVVAGKEYSLFFAGQNSVGGGTPESGDFFRVMFAPDGAQDLIGTKPGPLKMKATVLYDPSAPGGTGADPLSHFCRFKSA